MCRSVISPSARALIAVAVASLMAFPEPALAHGLGGRSDLPVPLGYFVAGALAVLVITFVALVRLWPQPRLQQPPVLHPIRVPGWSLIASGLRWLGIVGVGTIVMAGLFGADNSVRNPAPVLMWVGFWLIVPFASAAVGDLYHMMNPWDPLVRWAGRSKPERVWPVSLGLWPALVLFLGFVWLELIYPHSADPRTAALVVLIFGGLLVMVGDLWEGGLEGLDPFRTYNRLISALAPIRLARAEAPHWQGWLRGLPLLPRRPGMTAFVVVLIGAVTFDGLSATSWYDRSFGSFGLSMAGSSLLLLATCGLLGLAYGGACWEAARQAGGRWTTTAVAQRFAHTLVPIAFAYGFAHYFTLVIFEGQLILSATSDPFGRGWNLWGTARRPVDFTVLSPYAIWWVQVSAIVIGHVAGVVLAHDRALSDFAGTRAVRSQYVMLALMILLTTLGLVVLATI